MCCVFASSTARARCAMKGSLPGFRCLGRGRCSGQGRCRDFGARPSPCGGRSSPQPLPPPPRLRGPGRAMRAAGGAALAAAAAVTALALAVAAWRRARPVREVLFFPSRPCCVEALLAEAAEPGTPARPCPCPLPSGDTALSRLVRRLLSARRSLDLCLFSFSCPQLARAVQLLHRRGVRIRLVTDSQYMGLHGSQIGRLRHAGIQVRHDQHSGYMHHKFAIVDKRMLITGSLNWTTQAIQSNRENVLVVEDAVYVKAFLDEFERIWEEYNPANYTFFPQRR